MFASLRFNPDWGVSERLYIEDVERHQSPLLRRIAAILRGHYTAAGAFVAGQRVLDIACGSGYGSRMLRDAGADQVIGCDLVEAPLAHAREHHGRDGITYVQGDAQTFVWAHRFDVICSFETIEHLDRPISLLDRVDELLTPDGVFCLSVPLGETRHLDPFHRSVFTEQGIREALLRKGFEVVQTACLPLKFRCRDLLRLSRRMPETEPTLADLMLTRRGWWTIAAILRGLGSITFSQFFVVAHRTGRRSPSNAEIETR